MKTRKPASPIASPRGSGPAGTLPDHLARGALDREDVARGRVGHVQQGQACGGALLGQAERQAQAVLVHDRGVDIPFHEQRDRVAAAQLQAQGQLVDRRGALVGPDDGLRVLGAGLRRRGTIRSGRRQQAQRSGHASTPQRGAAQLELERLVGRGGSRPAAEGEPACGCRRRDAGALQGQLDPIAVGAAQPQGGQLELDVERGVARGAQEDVDPRPARGDGELGGAARLTAGGHGSQQRDDGQRRGVHPAGGARGTSVAWAITGRHGSRRVRATRRGDRKRGRGYHGVGSAQSARGEAARTPPRPWIRAAEEATAAAPRPVRSDHGTPKEAACVWHCAHRFSYRPPLESPCSVSVPVPLR